MSYKPMTRIITYVIGTILVYGIFWLLQVI